MLIYWHYDKDFFGAEGRGRTDTNLAVHWILSPARLPVPPLRRFKNNTILVDYYQEVH